MLERRNTHALVDDLKELHRSSIPASAGALVVFLALAISSALDGQWLATVLETLLTLLLVANSVLYIRGLHYERAKRAVTLTTIGFASVASAMLVTVHFFMLQGRPLNLILAGVSICLMITVSYAFFRLLLVVFHARNR